MLDEGEILKTFFLNSQAEDEEERQKNEFHKLLASEQRAAISQLYLERNRPSFENDVSKKFNSKYYFNHKTTLVHRSSRDKFLAGKRKLLRSAGRGYIMAGNGRSMLWREADAARLILAGKSWMLRQMSDVIEYGGNKRYR